MNGARTPSLLGHGSIRGAAVYQARFLLENLSFDGDGEERKREKNQDPQAFAAGWPIVDVAPTVKYGGSLARIMETSR